MVLITGANGFVGSKVFEILLEHGFTRLRCLVRCRRNLLLRQRMADVLEAQLGFFKTNLGVYTMSAHVQSQVHG